MVFGQVYDMAGGTLERNSGLVSGHFRFAAHNHSRPTRWATGIFRHVR